MKGIYIITCKANKKEYVGSALNLKKREREHFYNLRIGKHPNKKLQNSFNKYGLNQFAFQVLEVVEVAEKLLDREQFYIDTIKPFFNICQVAGSSLGLKRSEETKLKIKAANLGLKHPEWRNKIKSAAQGGEKHWTKTKEFSHASREKMSAAQKELYKNGYQHPNKKPIQQCTLNGELVKEWESATEVEKELNYSRKAIVQCLNGRAKTSCKFIWKYKIN